VVLLPYLIFEVFDYAVGYAPSDEIELGDGRHESLELDPGRPAEWVEELLGVTVQARFVRDVHGENLTIRGDVRNVLVLGVIRHEPFELAKRWRGRLGGVAENRLELLAILLDFKEAHETRQKKFRFIH
jgi:hypothetical protein